MSFRDHLLKFRLLQRVFQPEVVALLAAAPDSPSAVISDDDNVQSTNLLLPSLLPPETLAKTSKKLVGMEKQLQLGQCQDALTQLHGHLHSRVRILKDKYVNVRHQAPNTRSHNLLDRISAKVNVSVEKYRAAYAALLVLDSDSDAKWRSELKPLHQKDVRSMSDADAVHPTTGLPSNEGGVVPAHRLLPGGTLPEGSRTLSWIWGGVLNDDSSTPGYHECKLCTSLRVQVSTYYCFSAFRIEWSKARARSERWKEEVQLLREEMRRTLAFLESYTLIWNGRGSPCNLVGLSKDPAICEGITAYAERRSHVFASLHRRFHSIWNGLEGGGNPATESTPVVSEDTLMELPGGDI